MQPEMGKRGKEEGLRKGSEKKTGRKEGQEKRARETDIRVNI